MLVEDAAREGDFTLAGFGHDVAMGLPSVCPSLEVTVGQTSWSGCWTDGTIGEGLQPDGAGAVKVTAFRIRSLTCGSHHVVALLDRQN